MKSLQESRKRIYALSAFLGIFLLSVPIAATATQYFIYSSAGAGKSVNAVNNWPNTDFVVNTVNVTSGTSQINLVGTGGYDIFNFTAGASNASVIYTGTGSILLNNTFNIYTGNGTSIFSMISGPRSIFNIYQNNTGITVLPIHPGIQTFAITGGTNSTVFETSPTYYLVYTSFYSINLGANSTVDLTSTFGGNASTVNVVF